MRLRLLYAVILFVGLAALAHSQPVAKITISPTTGSTTVGPSGRAIDLVNTGAGVYRVSVRTTASTIDPVRVVPSDSSTLTSVGLTRALTGLVLEDGQTAFIEIRRRYLLTKALNTTVTLDIVRTE